MTTTRYVVLDRDHIEEDRYLVLLACGHWANTRVLEGPEWPCPVLEPREKNDGMQPAATTTDGVPAILVSYDLLGEAP